MWRFLLACLLLGPLCGCNIIPEIAHQPRAHNPFPQLSKVAVAPFVNLSSEPTVDGRQFAEAYFNELQAIPGFEVVPVGVVEERIRAHNFQFDSPKSAIREGRELAKSLGVDAVIFGFVTDFSPYYPPRCGLHVQWIAANPCFHPIPPGYGLPWGTTDEEHIPDTLVFEAEMALAKEQLNTQTPASNSRDGRLLPGGAMPPGPQPETAIQQTSAMAGVSRGPSQADTTGAGRSDLPAGWPDPKGFIPRGPSAERPVCLPSDRPVIEHTRIYNGHNADFMESLRTYSYFRDDARFGGAAGYLQRSEDFIRFCCHKHITETLTARGGASKTRVVWRWRTDR
jgi:hypothetical protein